MRRTVIALAGFSAAGNLTIVVVSALVRWIAPNDDLLPESGVRHLHAVDAELWRSSALSESAYTALAGRGVGTVVDLRAENDLRDDERHLSEQGVTLVRLPIRDGQTPTPEQVHTLLDTVRRTDEVVLVHCGAGVGRTGAIVGAYVVASGAATPSEALRRNLAVGPPSLEQIWYVARLGHGTAQPPMAVKVVSRFLDAPRRIWSRVRRRIRPGHGRRAPRRSPDVVGEQREEVLVQVTPDEDGVTHRTG